MPTLSTYKETIMEVRFTTAGNSYWDNCGAYQNEYDELDKLVPSEGHADTLVGEVVRASGILGYEYYNNGNCNACHVDETEGEWHDCPCCGGYGEVDDEEGIMITCPECDGAGGYSDEPEYEYSVDEFYDQFLQLLAYVFDENDLSEGTKCVEKVQEIIEHSSDFNESNEIFSEENKDAYNKIMDYAMAWAWENRDNKEPIPGWYQN